MNQDIKPIETIYKNYRFRSRLEARWAVFFDILGIAWEYEKEGYQTPFGNYVPDFWLPDVYMRWHKPKGMFLEVKPESYEDYGHDALDYVAHELKCGALLVKGFYPDDDCGGDELIEIAPGWDTPMMLQRCPECRIWQFQFPQYLDCPRCEQELMWSDTSLVLEARASALKYRFW